MSLKQFAGLAIVSLLTFGIIIVVATACGFAVAQRLPWTDRAKAAGAPYAAAVGLAPLLVGVATAMVLYAVPSQMHMLHVALVLVVLLIGAAGSVRSLAGTEPAQRETSGGRRTWIERMLQLLLAGFAIAVVADALTTPLVQNDALEYATVGRVLYESGDLRSYPVLDASVTSSGFYAPWTHPPLYVALAYLTYALQGTADETTLFRLIGPWCLLAATLCVATLGRQVSRTTGLIAGLICISTPMLYLGAASAQIDPVPVLGFALAFVGFTSLNGNVIRRGVGSGALLGLALWTHSQAILYPALLLPLLLITEDAVQWRDRLKFAVQGGGISVITALLVGGAPYVRNHLLFGAPISDNPPVFAYEPLGWADFFKWQRGLAHAQEIVQYGVLKGFFAVEAFSVGFWLALLGIPLALKNLWARLGPAGSEGAGLAVCLPAALVVGGMYLGGSILSAALGMDTMIRNERYLLVIMPCIALLAAVGLDHGARSRTRVWLLSAMMLMLGLQLGALEFYRQRIVSPAESASASSLSVPEAGSASAYLRQYTPEDAKVLALRPADMFFADRKMVSYLDPRMLSFYEQRKVEPAWRVLRSMGLSYVQLPDYALPPFYNSQLMPLLASQRYAELVYDRGGYQIYRLLDSSPAEYELNEGRQLQLRGLRRLKLGNTGIAQITVGEFDYQPGMAVTAWNESLLLRRMTTTGLVSDSTPTADFACSGGNADEYLVTVAASGSGFIQVFAYVESDDGSVERKSLGGAPLANDGRIRTFARRMGVPSTARTLRLEIEFRPVATVAVQRAEVQGICPVPGRSVDPSAQTAGH